MIETGIEPKTADAVRAWVNNGGKLKVGGDVLVGLRRWETLVAKTPETVKLLENMKDEVDAAVGASAKLVVPEELPSSFSVAQVHNALGYQAKGLEFVTKTQAKCQDLTPLLVAPQVLHGRPLSLKRGTKFEVLTDAEAVRKREEVEFKGFGKDEDGDILLKFLVEGQAVVIKKPDPRAAVSAKTDAGRRKATPGNKFEVACTVPGEILSFSVSPGDVLKAGAPLCVLESMKMEMKISVPNEIDGLEVKSVPCKGRTDEKQGDILAPGDLMLELQEPTK